MAYDAATKDLVLFGGLSGGSGGNDLADTWTFDPATLTWTRYVPATESTPWPTGGSGDSLVWDEANKGLLLQDATGSTFGTWLWKNNSWQQLHPANEPPFRSGASVGMDPTTEEPLLFSGYDGTQLLDDTWAWDGTNWTQKTVTSGPGPRELASVASPLPGSAQPLVLFGGSNHAGADYSDAWAWDGSAWKLLKTSTGPAPRNQAAMGWVQSSAQSAAAVMLFGGGSYTPTGTKGQFFRNSDTWTLSLGSSGGSGGSTPGSTGWDWAGPTSGGPAGLDGTAMAYDANTHQMVLFGGLDMTSPPNDPPTAGTYLWNGTAWSAAKATASPLARFGAAMATDANGDVILFGGYDTNNTPFDDMWIWANSTWTEVSPGTGDWPSARAHARMAFFPGHGVVLHGGEDQNGALSDTWIWDGTGWTKVVGAAPPARYGEGFAYDGANLVLFGGQVTDPTTFQATDLADTWTFDGSAWTQQSPTTHPDARFAGTMATDPTGTGAILYGGYSDAGGFFNDTWSWDGTTWMQLAPIDNPTSGRTDAVAVTDPINQDVVMFGGDSASSLAPLDETWIGSHPAAVHVAAYRTQLARALAVANRAGVAAQELHPNVGLPTTSLTTPLSSPDGQPMGVSLDSDGNAWVAERQGNAIDEVTPSGKLTTYKMADQDGYEGFGQPFSITQGPNGAMWFTLPGSNALGEIDPASGDITFHAVSEDTTALGVGDITTGPDGALWFTEFVANAVGRMTTDGEVTTFTVPTADAHPSGITTGPDGALWFTEGNTSKVARLDPASQNHITEYQIPTFDASPSGITSGPDGALWFTERDGNKIGRITTDGVITEFAVPTPAAGPFAITSDGHDLWFSEATADAIAQISPQGTFSQYALQDPDSLPAGLAVAKDGTIWVAENRSGALAHVTIPAPTVGGVGIPSGPTTASSSSNAPSADNPIVLTVTSPSGGSITFEPDTGTTGIPGFILVGPGFTVTAPPASAGNPLKLVFQVDQSKVVGGSPVGVFRDGLLASRCADSQHASPDPCVLDENTDGSGNVIVTVLSTHASDWQAAVPVAGSIATACRSVTTNPFTDMAGDVHADAAACLAAYTLANGTTATTFDPGASITRAQMASFLVRLLAKAGVTLPANPALTFSDVAATSSYAPDIAKLAAVGVTLGTGPRTFSPGTAVTRAQMASFLVRSYQLGTGRLLPSASPVFVDVAPGPQGADIAELAALGVTEGVGSGRYDPGRAVRRDEMASFLARTLDRLVVDGKIAALS